MTISDLMNRFAQFEYAVVGTGPKHPVNPKPDLIRDVEKFFQTYPKIAQDKGYVEFLEVYSGACIDTPEYEFVLSIYGLGLHLVNNVLYPDESLIEQQRFFRFTESFREHSSYPLLTTSISFGFDLSSDTPLTIYRQYTPRGTKLEDMLKTPFYWYCDTFTEWLTKVVEAKGDIVGLV